MFSLTGTCPAWPAACLPACLPAFLPPLPIFNSPQFTPPRSCSAAPYARQLLLEGSSLQDAQLAKMKQQFLKGAKLQVGRWVGGRAPAAWCWPFG